MSAFSRARHADFAISASSGSGSRSWATATDVFVGPFSSNVTSTRVERSPQSKRAVRAGCDVRKDIVPSVSHRRRERAFTKASNATSAGTPIVLEA